MQKQSRSCPDLLREYEACAAATPFHWFLSIFLPEDAMQINITGQLSFAGQLALPAGLGFRV